MPPKYLILLSALILRTLSTLPLAPGTIHPLPPTARRFDLPWRTPPQVHLPTLAESRNRILYSGVKEAVSDGLGHGMATINADIATALRLGLTYTHRVAKYGSLVSPSFAQELHLGPQNTSQKGRVAGLSEEAGRVEGFFGWGVGEIPREAVQDAACNVRQGDEEVGRCKLCSNSDLALAKANRSRGNRPALRVDRVVEIPMTLSYFWPHKMDARMNATLHEFLRRNNESNTVFHMPKQVCQKSPAYSKFFATSRAFFFHKYWNAHARYPAGDTRRRGQVVPSLRLYRESWRETLKIPAVPKRGVLDRLKEHEIVVAIHARRGDFFSAGRPMVSTRVFAKVVRRVVYEIARHNGTFAKMPVAVNIYSEGRPKQGLGDSVGHDVARLNQTYLDHDGTELDAANVTRLFRDGALDELGNVFRNGLRVALRVSEDTVLCLHEMVASDVFVGSRSGMSQHLVGSLSRGGVQLLPSRIDHAGEWYGHVAFDDRTGEVGWRELMLLRMYWGEFAEANERSARRAFETFSKSKRL